VSKKAARASDPTAHGGALEVAGSIPTVTVNGLPLCVVRRQHACPTHGAEGAPLGSTTVEAGGQGALREGDFLLGGGGYNRIAGGSPNVVIGSPMPG
jgi:uncharacterized Zn-binding protein involved in type VI secretion